MSPPRTPWLMAQVWRDLLFAHWPVPFESLRAHVPSGLELETFEGNAWLGVVPFRITGLRPHALPPFPGLSQFPELNLRTYVSAGGKPGVWFFSLDAGSRLAVAGARAAYALPYFNAEMSVGPDGEGVRYRSKRKDLRGGEAEFDAEYGPIGPVDPSLAPPGSLARWLTYRFCLYAQRPGGVLVRAEIDHPPWPLQNARAVFGRNTLADGLGIKVEGEPLLHFSRELSVHIWGPEKVE